MSPATELPASVDGLRREVIRLRGLLSDGKAVLPREWLLTASEEAVFRVLLAHDVASKALLAEAASTTPKAARVHIMRLRRALEPHRIVIETLQRRGWRLVGREHWAAILAPSSNH